MLLICPQGQQRIDWHTECCFAVRGVASPSNVIYDFDYRRLRNLCDIDALITSHEPNHALAIFFGYKFSGIVRARRDCLFLLTGHVSDFSRPISLPDPAVCNLHQSPFYFRRASTRKPPPTASLTAIATWLKYGNEHLEWERAKMMTFIVHLKWGCVG